MPHPMSPRDHREPKDHLQAVGFKLNPNQWERSVEDIAIIAREAEVHIKGEARTEVEICSKTIDATTAINQTLRENTKRGNQRGRGAVGMIRENVDETHLDNSADEEASQHASSIGWVNKNPVVHSWDSSSSDGDYMVMAIKHKRSTELKVAGAQLPIKINGKSTRV